VFANSLSVQRPDCLASSHDFGLWWFFLRRNGTVLVLQYAERHLKGIERINVRTHMLVHQGLEPAGPMSLVLKCTMFVARLHCEYAVYGSLLTVDWNLHLDPCEEARKEGRKERTFHSSGTGSGVPVAGRDAVKLPGSGQTSNQPPCWYSTVHRQPEMPSFDLTLLLCSVSLNPETRCISYAICDKPQFSGLLVPT
jgi:hypothetical protein